jgi:hypothetical protein
MREGDSFRSPFFLLLTQVLKTMAMGVAALTAIIFLAKHGQPNSHRSVAAFC